MTKILIVDDEPAQLRGLSRAILLRQRSYEILTAQSGAQAIKMIEEQEFDLVLTDLQMSDMDGLALLAWLLSERPSLLTFAMTAYGDEQTLGLLHGLGAIECFHKPLDVDAMLRRMAEVLAQTIRGHVQNVGLASFLQLIEMEQKSCTLEVRGAMGTGQLFVRKGELLDARTKDQAGEAAALTILGWNDVAIHIEGVCRVNERTIQLPLSHIIMEAMRIRDEAERARESDGAANGVRRFRSEVTGLGLRPNRATLRLPQGAVAMAVVELSTGNVLASEARADLSVAELAQGARALLRQQALTLARSSSNQELQEVFSMMQSYGELIRPLSSRDGFVVLMFDVQQTTLAMARLELDLFVGEYAPS